METLMHTSDWEKVTQGGRVLLRRGREILPRVYKTEIVDLEAGRMISVETSYPFERQIEGSTDKEDNVQERIVIVRQQQRDPHEYKFIEVIDSGLDPHLSLGAEDGVDPIKFRANYSQDGLVDITVVHRSYDPETELIYLKENSLEEVLDELYELYLGRGELMTFFPGLGVIYDDLDSDQVRNLKDIKDGLKQRIDSVMSNWSLVDQVRVLNWVRIFTDTRAEMSLGYRTSQKESDLISSKLAEVALSRLPADFNTETEHDNRKKKLELLLIEVSAELLMQNQEAMSKLGDYAVRFRFTSEEQIEACVANSSEEIGVMDVSREVIGFEQPFLYDNHEYRLIKDGGIITVVAKERYRQRSEKRKSEFTVPIELDQVALRKLVLTEDGTAWKEAFFKTPVECKRS